MTDGSVPREGEILFYTGAAGDVRVEVLFEKESFWLTQKRMAELFDVDVRTVSEHLRNVFRSGELEEGSVIRKFRTTAADGKSYLTSVYNLDAIIAVGYRVNSRQATQFRKTHGRTVGKFLTVQIEGENLEQPRRGVFDIGSSLMSETFSFLT